MMYCHFHGLSLFPRRVLLTCFGDEILGEMDALTQPSCS